MGLDLYLFFKVCKYSRNCLSLEHLLTILLKKILSNCLYYLLMTTKKKYKLEYELRSSPKILFNFLSTPNGLAEWFASDVTIRDGIYSFHWDNEIQKAKLLTIKDNKMVKFKWEDDEAFCFFEFEVMQDELTGDVALGITDFASDEEKEEKIMIWKSQVDTLISVIGA